MLRAAQGKQLFDLPSACAEPRAKIVRVPDAKGADAAPGTVIGLDRLGPVVKCGDTALLLTEVKPEGSSAMDGGAFLRGRPLKPFEDRLLTA